VTWEHLHLIAHSFPIVLCLSGTLVGIFGWVRDRPELELWGIVALLIAGALVVPAYLTGLAAADVVGDRLFVRPGIIQTHRFAATWAVVPVFTAGALAAFSLYEREDRKLRHFVLVVGLLASGTIGYAAVLGSRIKHGTGPDADTAAAEAEVSQAALPDATVVVPASL